jgi:secreted PhoX family phosphatase
VTELDRRSFLKRSAAVTAGTAVLGGPFQGFVAGGASAAATPDLTSIAPLPDEADGVVRLALPKGFRYRSFQASSKAAPITLDDGSKLPGRHDGMAGFHRSGGGHGVVLVRNHEEPGAGPSFGAPGTPTYDPMTLGGTSTVEVSHEGVVARSWASLSGTQNNCSGGPMPWGSWITCEETVNGPDVFDDFTRGSLPAETYVTNAKLTKPHGFIFEVPVEGAASAVPIRNAGRFSHESVAWSPKDGALYLSEDDFSFASGFYRYVPPEDPMVTGRLADGGTLWMLKVVGVDKADLARKQPAGAVYDVEWVPIDDPWFEGTVPPSDTNDDAIRFVSAQGLAQGAAMFSRLEGTIYDRGWVYFTSTQGGFTDAPSKEDTFVGFGTGWGQIWAYDTVGQQLHMLYESPGRDTLDYPDNVTTSPRGTLVVCEDHDQNNFLRGLTRDGRLITIAQNVIANRTGDEFAGSTFSPDGRTLFVNIQAGQGMTFAIWGPWGRIGV